MSDIELQDLEFGWLHLFFIWPSNSSYTPFLPLRMRMYILYHYMLEVCDLFLDFDLQGVTDKKLS